MSALLSRLLVCRRLVEHRFGVVERRAFRHRWGGRALGLARGHKQHQAGESDPHPATIMKKGRPRKADDPSS